MINYGISALKSDDADFVALRMYNGVPSLVYGSNNNVQGTILTGSAVEKSEMSEPGWNNDSFMGLIGMYIAKREKLPMKKNTVTEFVY